MVAAEHMKKALILIGAAVVGICLPAVLDLTSLVGDISSGGSRRSLTIKHYRESIGRPSELLPSWARSPIIPSYETPRPLLETALFWYVPQSGGETVKNIYECMGQTLASRTGGLEKFGHHKDTEIIVFEPFRGSDVKTVNVDVTSREGILRAKEMGLAASGKSDLIVTTEPSFAGEHLINEVNKGRFFGMFRHPVERAISKFYFLQKATWERTYRPEWKGVSIEEWASTVKGNRDNNFLVRKLNGKNFNDTVGETDLQVAKDLLGHKFIVGLMTDMEESVRRFNVILGLDEGGTDEGKAERVYGCMLDFFGPKSPPKSPKDEEMYKKVHKFKQLANDHPKVKKDGEVWKILEQRNSLDMQLYAHAVQLFKDQEQVITDFIKSSQMSRERRIVRIEDRRVQLRHHRWEHRTEAKAIRRYAREEANHDHEVPTKQ